MFLKQTIVEKNVIIIEGFLTSEIKTKLPYIHSGIDARTQLS